MIPLAKQRNHAAKCTRSQKRKLSNASVCKVHRIAKKKAFLKGKLSNASASAGSAVVGVAGFEPANDGVKVRCLTAWLYPSFAMHKYTIFYVFCQVRMREIYDLAFSRKQNLHFAPAKCSAPVLFHVHNSGSVHALFSPESIE